MTSPTLAAPRHDPQTSGGLPRLVPVAETDCLLAQPEGCRVVGRAVPPGPKTLIVLA